MKIGKSVKKHAIPIKVPDWPRREEKPIPVPNWPVPEKVER